MSKRADPNASVASRFRAQIAEAEATGAKPTDLVLNLTHGDAIKLQRDGKIAVADISFLGGEMRYLGVVVVRGGVAG